MLYIAIGMIGAALWIAYEIKRAPFYDEETKTFYYDKDKHSASKKSNEQAPNSGTSRDKESTKRSKKTKGN